jgi:hypothetical protein
MRTWRAGLLSDDWIELAEAVRRIAGLLEAGKGDNLTDRRRQWDIKRKRESVAKDELYEALRRGHVRSRAGRVFVKRRDDGDFSKPEATWALANWSIPASLWQVMRVYNWDHNSAATWVWPANEPAPPGWPKSGSVDLTDIEVMLGDVQRLWPDSDGAGQAGDTAVSGGRHATVQQETDAIRALAPHLKANPQLRRVDAAEWCRTSGYNLGKRSFDRVWPQAREDAGLPRIGSRGRKRKSTC